MGKLFKFLARNIQTVLLIIGILLFSTGIFMINIPAGFIALGIVVTALAVVIDRQIGGDKY